MSAAKKVDLAEEIRRQIIGNTRKHCFELSRHLLCGSRPEDVHQLVVDAVEGAFVTREEWPNG